LKSICNKGKQETEDEVLVQSFRKG
jgi:hypothetical protein